MSLREEGILVGLGGGAENGRAEKGTEDLEG